LKEFRSVIADLSPDKVNALLTGMLVSGRRLGLWESYADLLRHRCLPGWTMLQMQGPAAKLDRTMQVLRPECF
jgi:hypothetical protein